MLEELVTLERDRRAPLPGPSELLRDQSGILIDQRHLDQLVRDYGQRAREAAPLALVRIDLDKFKIVNDAHGHPIGNKVLETVFVAIVRVIDGHGAAIRAGGDEIVVLLPNCASEEAVATAERLRAAIEGAKIEHAGQFLGVTSSLGVAVYPLVALGVLDAVADRAAYKAKRAGGNRVLLAKEHTVGSVEQSAEGH